MSGASEVPALLPCPFCGGDAKVVDATQVLGTWKVIHRCKTVGYLCVETSERERAIADWNRRPVDTGREKALEEAARYLERRADEMPNTLTAIGVAKILRGEAASVRALANPENGRG